MTSLDEYDHLHRVFRLCVVHVFRNIRACPVPDHVRLLMRSLVCIEHDNWDETIARIRQEGGKAANGELLFYNMTDLVFLRFYFATRLGRRQNQKQIRLRSNMLGAKPYSSKHMEVGRAS